METKIENESQLLQCTHVNEKLSMRVTALDMAKDLGLNTESTLEAAEKYYQFLIKDSIIEPTT